MDHSGVNSKFNLGFTIVLVLLLGASLLLQTHYLLWGEWSFDQGHNLLIVRLMDYGYQPYTEIFMDRPPLFFWSISLPFSFFGSVEGIQLVMVGYALLAIAALVSIGLSLDGKLTALLAGALFSFNFVFFFSTRKVDPEIPALSLGLVALALALRYHSTGSLFWLIASGIVMGGSLLINYFMPWIIPLIILILINPAKNNFVFDIGREFQHNRPRILRNSLLWSGIVLGVALASWFVFNVSKVFDQAILFHLYKSAGTERNLIENLELIWISLTGQPLLSICAALGLALALANFKRKGWILAIWSGLTLLFLFFYSPLRAKHLIILPPIQAVLVAPSLAYPFKLWLSQAAHPRRLRWAGLAGGVVGSILLIIELISPYEALAKPNSAMLDEDMQPLAALLGQFTSPADCLITDNPYLAFVANRLPPPWLANLSYARFDSNVLDTRTMIDITESHNCQVIAPILDRVKNANRPYYDWAKATYLRVWVVDGKEIMLGKPLASVQPETPFDINFADQVQLVGADWLPGDQGGYLSLYWKTLRPFTQNYKIFVQLRDGSGQTVASADHEAYDGLIPSQLWPVGAILKDTNYLNWPADLQPGGYSLYVGFYNPATLERLPINGDASGENAVVIPGIALN